MAPVASDNSRVRLAMDRGRGRAPIEANRRHCASANQPELPCPVSRLARTAGHAASLSLGTRRDRFAGFAERALLLQAFAEHPAEPEGIVGPVALRGGRRRGLLELLDLPHAAAQPEQHIGPGPLGGCGCDLPELPLQTRFEGLRIGALR